MKCVKVNDIELGGRGLVIIAGPCVIEDEATTLKTLEALLRITNDAGVPFIFKASYDKANRTSADSFRGPGLEAGLKVLAKAKKDFPVTVMTDVHCVEDVEAVAMVADVVQVPAFLCRQTDLLKEVARHARAVNIKKGQFMAPWDMAHSVDKVVKAGNENLFITERGTSFGYNNLVVDFRSLPLMRELGYPVVFDATHSVQLPSAGKGGSVSGGDRRMAGKLSRGAVAVGVDGIFMEVHPAPDTARCDGPNSIALDDVAGIIAELKAIDEVVKGA